MIIIGIILIIAGIASAIHGNTLNNNFEAQLLYALEKGEINPGNTWIYIGIAVAIIGLILLLIGIFFTD